MEGGAAYYRKKFSVSKESGSRRIFIEFEGVMMDSTVWVNGCFIGSHLSGYTGFAYDISDYLFYGEEGENVILVKTETHLKEGWWAEGAGIYRNAWLTEVPYVHVKRNGTFVYCRFPDTDRKYDVCNINLDVEIENSSFSHHDFMVKNILISPDGFVLSTTETSSSLEAVSECKIQTAFNLQNPLLWDIDSPKLYLMRTQILIQGEIMDVYETPFGIRDIKYSKEGLVLNENRRFGSSSENLDELYEMIKSSRNHPSIFMWSLENEEFIASLQNGRRILKSLAEHAKALDPSRPTTMAGHFAIRDELYNAIPAVAGFNYDMDDVETLQR
ncbi:MAG TPA: hypothetical protein GXX75_11340 [Clostridiales bacterium]|nr:hypothetical protein [Clostridiales bacterium]